MFYELFQQGASVYVPIMLISLAITLAIYSLFPLLFAIFRKNSITSKKYDSLCYGFNILIAIVFTVAASGMVSFGGYVLWTVVFSMLGNKILQNRGLLEKSKKSNSAQIHADNRELEPEPKLKLEQDVETGRKGVRTELAVGIGATLFVGVVLIMVLIGMASQNREVTYGYCEGDAYINSYTGYGCKLDKTWVVQAAEDLLQDGEVEEAGCVMRAICAETYSIIELYYDKLSLSNRITTLYMSNEGVVDQVLSAEADELKEELAEQGIENIAISKETVTFLGEECVALKLAGKRDDVSLYLLQVYNYKLGEYGTILQCISFITDTTQDMLDRFYALD